MRRYEVNDPTQMMNDIVRDKAYLNGIKFIDIQAQFADESGNYSAYGPDITGRQRLLREADGVGFTFAGNRKLALFVEQEIKRDLSQARKEDRSRWPGSEKRARTHQRLAAAFQRRAGHRRRRQERQRQRAGGQGSRSIWRRADLGAGNGRRLGPEGRQRPHHLKEHRRRRARENPSPSTCRGRPFPPRWWRW